ncbi:hypothetical protein WA026_019718 [Henosepilachna vigintioctopunctata]|uniref:SCP domain-containing protein n=1 Tax=Henosepilachna vigintioctopunctata TaxID=420089 RepID=A0AAW1UEU9_9CUCU
MAMSSFGILGVLLVIGVNYGSSYCPSGIYEQGVSAADRSTIVNKHNYLRGLISQGKVAGQPRATNMKHMQYSTILEQKAQEIANSCEFRHVTVTGTPWSWVGQNLYLHMSTGYGTGANWNEAIQSWFDEHKIYRFGSGFSSGTGHYTQMVWADTDNVGCGYAYYAKYGGFKYQKLYVCNYGPGGNYVGQNPYRT